MAHKSHRKHLKNLRKHEPATPRPNSPIVKAEIAERRIAKPAANGRKAASDGAKKPASKKRGIVRSIAHAAAERVAAKPKKLLSKAKARVKSILGAA